MLIAIRRGGLGAPLPAAWCVEETELANDALTVNEAAVDADRIKFRLILVGEMMQDVRS